MAQRGPAAPTAQLLARQDLDDRVRLELVAKTLAEEQLVLVLDDFEQNLLPGGSGFLDPDVGDILRVLADSPPRPAACTSRYPVPDAESYLRRVPIGPLSQAESRKLVLRLPKLQELDAAALAKDPARDRRPSPHARTVGRPGPRRTWTPAPGDPQAAATARPPEHRSGGRGRPVGRGPSNRDRARLAQRFPGGPVGPGPPGGIGSGPVAGGRIELAGLAGGSGPDAGRRGRVASWRRTWVERAIGRLQDLSLVHRFPDGSAWVHRWTAEGLARLDEAGCRASCVRAGRYRWWRRGERKP